jgi:poly(A) polymerase Pap1
MFVEFFTSNNIRVQVLEISVLLHKSAFIQCYCFLPSGLTLYKLDMTEEDYSKWSDDDDYIKQWICSKISLLGVPVDNVEGLNNQPVLQSNLDDNRSVHNEADLQKIQTLQEQLDQQASKLKVITDMLIGKGMI